MYFTSMIANHNALVYNNMGARRLGKGATFPWKRNVFVLSKVTVEDLFMHADRLICPPLEKIMRACILIIVCMTDP